MKIEELLKKFQITPEDISLVRAAGEILIPNLGAFIDEWYVWLKEMPEFNQFFPDVESLPRIKKLQLENWDGFFKANIDEAYLEHRRHIGRVHARIDLPNDIYFAGMSRSNQLLVARLRDHNKKGAEVEEMVLAIGKLIYLDCYLVLDTITSLGKEKIAEHSKAMLEMSTPVTSIWEGILLLPLVGIIDSHRTQDVMNKTLEKIAESRAKMFVLDISGVAAVDTGVANHLIKISKATKLMGCKSIISGISPAIARTLVELGVNVGDVETTATLRDAFEFALKSLGESIAGVRASD
jgi:rsbT co-antagonist protein RsbR